MPHCSEPRACHAYLLLYAIELIRAMQHLRDPARWQLSCVETRQGELLEVVLLLEESLEEQ